MLAVGFQSDTSLRGDSVLLGEMTSRLLISITQQPVNGFEGRWKFLFHVWAMKIIPVSWDGCESGTDMTGLTAVVCWSEMQHFTCYWSGRESYCCFYWNTLKIDLIVFFNWVNRVYCHYPFNEIIPLNLTCLEIMLSSFIPFTLFYSPSKNEIVLASE